MGQDLKTLYRWVCELLWENKLEAQSTRFEDNLTMLVIKRSQGHQYAFKVDHNIDREAISGVHILTNESHKTVNYYPLPDVGGSTDFQNPLSIARNISRSIERYETMCN